MIASLFLLALSFPARSATCDTQLKKAKEAPKEELAPSYLELAKCDPNLAETTFPTLVTKADDSDALSALFLAAVDTDGWNAVWATIGKISDYTARDVVAADIGRVCPTDPKVVAFLQGAYFGLKDIEFKQWDDAFVACESPKIDEWLVKQIEAPPASSFDEKYNTLLEIFVKKERAQALPHLVKAALKAADNGPFDAILIQMDAAVAPELGDEPTPEDAKALEASLVEVAKGVSPERARSVADRLVNVGQTGKALELLKVVYADRLEGGQFIYGAAAIEQGDCKGVKMAVVHWAQVKEPGSRWDVRADLEAPLRAMKPRLPKCDPIEGDWPVLVSPEPLAGASGLSEWVFQIERDWKAKGFEVTARSEEGINLP